MKKLLLLALLLFSTEAFAQNTTCSDRPPTDSSNACANTRWAKAYGGTPGGTSGQFQYNNSGVFGGSAILEQYTSGASTFIGVGDNIADAIARWTGTRFPILVYDRMANWPTINDNTVTDMSVLTASNASGAYASQSSRVMISSSDSQAWNHLAGFESFNNYNGTGSISEMWGFYASDSSTGSGVIGAYKRFRASDGIGASAPITNNYGLYIESLTRGLTSNWSIWTVDAPSRFGGYAAFESTAFPTLPSGRTVLAGTLTPTVLTNNGSGVVFNTSNGGLTFQGKGSFADFIVRNSATNTAIAVPTGTVNVNIGGNLNVSAGYYVNPTQSVKTTNYSFTDTDSTVTFNCSGGCTATLQSAASYTGRRIRIRTVANQLVSSSANNVVPLVGGAAGSSILAATAGKWADLESDGTNWVITAGN